MASQYHPSPMYVPQWGTHSGYPENYTQQMGSGTSMQYVYPPYLQQPMPNSMPHQSPVHPNEPNVSTMSPSSSSLLSKGLSNSSLGKVTAASPMSGNFSTALSSTPVSHGPMYNPYYVQGGAPWPINSGPNAGMSHSHGSETIRGITPNQLQLCGPEPGFRTPPDNFNVQGAIVPVTESKRTAQRKQQRETKRNFKEKYTERPMMVEADSSGEIDPSVKSYVHKMIRASAKRFLDLTVIKFRDQRDADIQDVKKDLEKVFIFSKKLRPDCVLDYVESSIKNARYEYHKYWIETGRGEKHEDCPSKIFPQLVKHWLTKESEEEIREQRAERAAERQRIIATREANGKAPATTEESWNVRICTNLWNPYVYYSHLTHINQNGVLFLTSDSTSLFKCLNAYCLILVTTFRSSCADIRNVHIN